MKIFLISLALIISAAFVFEVHQLTKAVREPKVQLNVKVRELCGARATGKPLSNPTRECVRLLAKIFPLGEAR